MPNIIDKLNGDLTEYQSIPFWSWNDDLKPEKLRAQIREMKSAGIGGFFMHARGGLMTEYMGEDWMKCTAACIDEARKLGMHAWAYDENGWPSGFAGMKLLENPENYAHYLTFEEKDSFDCHALGCYRIENGRLVRVYDDDGSPVKAVYDNTNDSVVDILNWQIVRQFIDETHEKYFKRFGKDFGKVLMGFFTDEPQYFRYETAFTPVMLAKYKKKYNEDMLDELGALFIDCEQSNRFRYRYWLMMNELYTEAFAGQIYRWCEEHKCALTGHSIEESSLFGQMMCCGGIMPFYEYEHTPGMDWLGRRISTEMAPRQVSSVAMQLGKKHVITETFACCGWDVTPKELKRIAEWQYVNGVNQMCQHLYPYSIRGQRKRDYPAFYSNHNPWTKDFRHFNDYFTRLGYMLSESREIADTVVIHPIHSAYFTFNRKDSSTLKGLDSAFQTFVEKLGAAGVLHHYADESLLAKYGKVKGKKLAVGKCAYSTVVVPDMPGIDETTLNLLEEFVKAGGRLCFAGQKPHLVNGEEKELRLEGNISLDELCNPGFELLDKDTAIRMTVRRSEFGDFIYAVNLSDKDDQLARLHINAKGARKFNLETGEFEEKYFTASPEGGIDIPFDFRPSESEVVFLSGSAISGKAAICGEMKHIPAPEAVIDEMDPNTFTVDYAALSYDGKEFTEPLPIMALSDRLLRERTNRTIYLKYTFDVTAKPAGLRLEAEDIPGSELTLNGEALTSDKAGDIDDSFRSYDLSGKLCLGENELIMKLDYYQPEHVYKVFNGVYYDNDGTTESLVNCLSYVTDIESVYLRGNFCVDCEEYTDGEKRTLSADGHDFSITLPRRHVTLSSILKDGFPFFGGSVKLRFELTADGTEQYLRLNGRYATAKVSVNGGKEQLLMFTDTAMVKGQLYKGVNVITLTLTNSYRNVMGPHHETPDPEPFGIGPHTFQKYGEWKDGQAKTYTDRYSFTFFGIDSIDLY